MTNLSPGAISRFLRTGLNQGSSERWTNCLRGSRSRAGGSRRHMLESIPPFWLFLATFFLGSLSLMIWWVFLRPVERKAAVGMITQKTYKGPGETWQQPTGI